MTLAEIKAWLAEHAEEQEVKDYLAGLSKVTAEGVKTFLDTTDGKKLIQPTIDSAVSKGIDTWKANNLDAAVEKLYNEKHPPEDERDKKLRELEQRLERNEAEKKQETLKAAAIKQAVEKGLPVDFIDRFIGEDDATTTANIEAFAGVFKAAVDAGVEARFKAGPKPKTDDGKPGPTDDNPWKKETWNLTKQGRIIREDPEKAKALKAAAGIKT
jgi:hypothetical protein